MDGRKKMKYSEMMSVKEKTASKKKSKPIKVVYISNPMKVNTSASEFRALVQELTGQDAAELPPHPNSIFPHGAAGEGHRTEYSKNICAVAVGDEDTNNRVGMKVPNHIWEGQVGSSMEWYEPLDEVDHLFTAQMMDTFSAILPPSGAFYESAPQLDHMLTTTSTLHAL